MNFNPHPRLGARAWAAIATMSLATVIVLIFAGGARSVPSVHAGPDPQSAAVSAAQDLAVAPNIVIDTPDSFDPRRRIIGADAVRRRARVLQDRVPLPPGDDMHPIDWSEIDGVTPSQIEQFVEYRAACSWYRSWQRSTASSDGQGAEHAATVIGLIPDWPTNRLQARGAQAQVIADALAQGDRSRLDEQVKINCSDQPAG